MRGTSVPKFLSAPGSLASRCFLTAACVGGFLFSEPAVAQSSGTSGSILFDIPAQPLDQTLDAFAAASGLQIFYENSLTTGRHSTGVKGMFEPQAALRVLLRGSGLTAQVIAAGTISIAKPRDADSAEAKRKAEVAYFPYYGLLQAGVMKALCGRVETRPGNYHITLQYWIDVGGRIAHLRLIGPSGSGERDAAIMGAMQALVLPPPGDMPQPVTMTIEPTQPVGCVAADVEGQRGR